MHLTTKIKQELEKLGIKPNKRLGQNFLVTQSTYKKIVDSMDLNSNEKVVEVGPGLGTLTEYLRHQAGSIVAIEKDAKLANYLESKFSSIQDIHIIKDDILKFDPASISLEKGKYKLVGNIPYYLTSKLLRVVFESWPVPQSATFMMQLEVANKIIAKPPNMTLLAVAMQFYTTPKIIAKVSAGNFYPPPDVDSAIVQFVPRDYGNINKEAVAELFHVVTAGFGQKRKQLINTLPSGLKISKGEAQKALEQVGISPKERAQSLTLNQWQILTEQLSFLQ